MSDHIPPEVVIQILIHCEVATVLRCKCVSKQWRAMIDDPDFIKQHTHYSITTNTDYSLFFIKKGEVLYASDLDTSQPYFKSPHMGQSLPDFRSWYFVGSCNGLLCLLEKCVAYGIILNPSTQEKLSISNGLPNCFRNLKDYSFNDNGQLTAYGFGYDNISDDYKIVGVIQIFGARGWSEPKMVIYHVKTRETKEVEIPYFNFLGRYCMGILTGGALHWIVGRLGGSRRKKRVIVGFDLGTEEFRELPQPEYSATDCKINMSLLGTWLCIFANNGDQMDFDVWVMKEYGVKESWTKIFSIPFATFLGFEIEMVKPLGFSKNGRQVLLDFKKLGDFSCGRFIWFDIKKKRAVKVMNEGSFESIICLRCLTPLPSIH